MTKQEAIEAVEAAGWSVAKSYDREDHDAFYLHASDNSPSEGARALREIQAALPGLDVSWTGSSNTDADGETTSEIGVSGFAS